jgi:hypothetical protein
MALLPIKRPEYLRECNPTAFGRLLGLDRAPKVKTLRRQLTRPCSPPFALRSSVRNFSVRVSTSVHMGRAAAAATRALVQ